MTCIEKSRSELVAEKWVMWQCKRVALTKWFATSCPAPGARPERKPHG